MKHTGHGSRYVSGTSLFLFLVATSALAEQNAGSSVQSLNGLKGKLTLAAGTGTSIVKTGSKTLTITGLALPYFGGVSSASPALHVVNSVPSGFTGTTIRAELQGSGGFAIEGVDNSAAGTAGMFWGSVGITGTVWKGGGSFKIDHPLDPENKYLCHSFVESPDMKNIYDGTVVLDSNGQATIELAEWYEALNKDFRYQLTCVGGFAPVFIRDEIANNRFTIAGGLPGMKVSWQVTGIRKDPFANAHRIPVEEEKRPEERGYYLHPDAYGKPTERGVLWTQTPDQMRQFDD